MPAKKSDDDEERSYRDRSTVDSRAIEFQHTIDPGFVNRRLIQTILGPKAMEPIDIETRKLPHLPEGLLEVRIDQLYSYWLLEVCKHLKIVTLGQLLADGHGTLFCSTEVLKPCPKAYSKGRVSCRVVSLGNSKLKVVLEFSSEHIRSDTLKMELRKGGRTAVIARFHRMDGETLTFHPLVMGAPWFHHENEDLAGKAMWLGYQHNEDFLEDFDEFSKVRALEMPASCDPMKAISENAFKQCLAKILRETTNKDWGGETSDHYTTHVHLKGRRMTGTFLLKGPAKFAPMKLNHLGKNNDQIVRLAQDPAEVLFVQHCHDIDKAVRSTLRAFAVQPSHARRYCLIDGKDSLRLLQAYGLYDEAVALSAKPARRRSKATKPSADSESSRSR